MAVGAVVARILTQYSDKGSKQAQKDLMKLGRSFDAYAKKAERAVGLVAIAATAAAIKIGKDSVMAASDISQQFGALDAVFGNNAQQLKDFSKEMVEYGLSAADSARYSALLGTQLTGLGLSQEDAIKRTKTLQILGADLAATFGGTTADAIAAFGSVLKGEYNPIERYGVAIRKSDITARVASKGLGKLAGETLKAAEAQAAFELIMEKTGAAQGQAMREYDTLAAQLQRVDASYKNIQASLGLALLPVVEQFTNYILTDILPGIQEWVETNKVELSQSLATAAEFAKDLLKVAGGIAKWATNNTTTLKNIAKIIAGMFVASKVAGFIIAIGNLVKAFQILRATAIGVAIANAFATGGVSLAAAGVALAAIGITAVTAKLAMGDYAFQTDAATKATDKYTQAQALAGFKSIETATNAANAARDKAIADKLAAKAAAENAAAQAKADKDKAKRDAIDKKNAALKKQLENKFGVKLTDKDEYENIQLTAVAKLQAKQKEADKSLKDRIKLRQDELAAFKKIGETEISDKEIKKLQLSWGMTKEQAKQYLEFLKVVEAGPISEENIKKLAKTWYGSDDASAVSAAKKYAGFVEKLGDGTLSQKDLETLKANWGLTDKQVVEYIAKIGVKADATGTILSAGDIAAIGWTKATTAFDAYLTKVNNSKTNTGVSTVPNVGGSSSVATASAALDTATAGGNMYAVRNAGVALAAAQEAARKAAQIQANAETLARFKAKEAADLAASQAAAQAARQASELAQQMQNQKIMTSYASFKAKELADEQAYNTFKSSTLSNASGLMGSGGTNGNTTVNLTVNGTVSTEQDLVNAVRNGLLRTQYNGSQINLQAV